ncbi:hypothetical protein [Neisseria iguanae]|uniref:hypothetical protein n=1 Tax=Neisseria iguanae TaxID=90242 RepID=UPI0014736F49
MSGPPPKPMFTQVPLRAKSSIKPDAVKRLMLKQYDCRVVCPSCGGSWGKHGQAD